MSGSFVAHYADTIFSIKRDTEVRKAYMPGTDVGRLYDSFMKDFLLEIEQVKPSIIKILKKLDSNIKQIEPRDFFLPDITFSDTLSDISKFPVILKIPVRPSNYRGVFILEIILKKRVDKQLIEEIQKEFLSILEDNRKDGINRQGFPACIEDYPFPYITSFSDLYAVKIESLYRTRYTNVNYYKKQFRSFLENELKPIIESLINDSTFERETETQLIPFDKIFNRKKGEFSEDLIDFKHEMIIKQTGFLTCPYTHYATRMNVILVFGAKNIQKGKLFYRLNEKIEMIFNEKKDIIGNKR